jgi:O-antigen/teichoic acid export membrane protein
MRFIKADKYNLLFGKLKSNVSLHKIIANTSWLFFERIFRMIVTLFVGVWVARYLGPEQFGLLNYAQAFVALFTAIATLGLDGIVIRNIVNSPKDTQNILGTSFVLKLVGGFFCTIITLLAVFILRPGDNQTLILVAIISTGMIFQSFNTIDFWFQAQIQSKYTVYARSIGFMTTSIIKIILILTNAPLITFAAVSAIEFLVGSIGLIAFYKYKGFSMFNWKVSVDTAKSLLKDSWPIILSGLAIMIYMRIDQIMIGEMKGDTEVGVYSVAVKLGELWYFVPAAIVNSTFPSIVNAKNKSDELFFSRTQKLYDLMALLGYAVAIPMTFLSTFAVELLYGKEFASAGPILSMYIWVGVFVNLGLARSSFLKTVNWTKIQFLTSVGGCVLNVILNFLLIPRYGAEGATFASIISYWFQAHGACFFIPKMRKTAFMLTKALFIPFRIKTLLNFK